MNRIKSIMDYSLPWFAGFLPITRLKHVVYITFCLSQPLAAGDNALIKATKAGDIKKCFECISDGIPITSTDEYGKTALHIATYAGNSDLCKLLLEKGAQPSVKDPEHQTSLHIACKTGHHIIADLLLLYDKNVLNTFNIRGETPLCIATKKGDTILCSLLLQQGADFDAPTYREGDTPLHQAAAKGFTSVCQLLIENGAFVTSTNVQGYTALDCAIEGSHSETSIFLFSKISENNDSWLLYLFRAPTLTLCKKILDHFFDLEKEKSFLKDLTPLHALAFYKRPTHLRKYGEELSPLPAQVFSDNEKEIMGYLLSHFLQEPGCNVDIPR